MCARAAVIFFFLSLSFYCLFLILIILLSLCENDPESTITCQAAPSAGSEQHLRKETLPESCSSPALPQGLPTGLAGADTCGPLCSWGHTCHASPPPGSSRAATSISQNQLSVCSPPHGCCNSPHPLIKSKAGPQSEGRGKMV